jgi:hypothetical protein
MPRPDNAWMNDQLRERAGVTINRDGAGEEINDALRVARGYEPRHPATRVRVVQPVGPEPDPAKVDLRATRTGCTSTPTCWMRQHGCPGSPVTTPSRSVRATRCCCGSAG